MWVVKMTMACLLYGIAIAIVYDKGFDKMHNPTKTGQPVQRTVRIEMTPVSQIGKFSGGKK